MGAGPQPCGVGAVRGFARRHLASAGEGASAHSVALLEPREAAAWRARPGRGHAGYPHRGARGDRGTGRQRRCTFTRARTATGWGTPYLKIVVLTVFAPLDEGDEPPPCLSGSRRFERRSANIGDAALVEECVETWEGDAAMRGQEGNVSSPLRGRHPSVAPVALCPSAYAYEWDSRVSLTS